MGVQSNTLAHKNVEYKDTVETVVNVFLLKRVSILTVEMLGGDRAVTAAVCSPLWQGTPPPILPPCSWTLDI